MFGLILLLAGSGTMPAHAPEQTSDPVVATGWSLESDSSKARKAPATSAPPQKAKPSLRAKLRLIGGARVSSSKFRSRKGSASVGVAVPF